MFYEIYYKLNIVDVRDNLINELVKFIKNGSIRDAESVARNLANARVKVDFSLIDKNDNEERNITRTKPDDIIEESSDSVLQLVFKEYILLFTRSKISGSDFVLNHR